MPTNKPRYTLIVDEEMLKEIDDFRFENRFPSRSAATLYLIRHGLEQVEKEMEEKKKRELEELKAALAEEQKTVELDTPDRGVIVLADGRLEIPPEVSKEDLAIALEIIKKSKQSRSE